MRLLIKFPTRGRPAQFLKTLHGWLSNADDLSRISVLVSYDEDDATMTPEVVATAESMHPALIMQRGHSKSKIDACNRDLPEYGGSWDVVLLISDDMWSRRKGWDSVIEREMDIFSPGSTDCALWFFDGSQKRINTLECVGYSYWSRRRYLYHPDYKSFWSDNESTAVGLRDKKLHFIVNPICTHEHPCWGKGMKQDATYQRNHPYWAQDAATFKRRQAEGFPA